MAMKGGYYKKPFVRRLSAPPPRNYHGNGARGGSDIGGGDRHPRREIYMPFSFVFRVFDHELFVKVLLTKSSFLSHLSLPAAYLALFILVYVLVCVYHSANVFPSSFFFPFQQQFNHDHSY